MNDKLVDFFGSVLEKLLKSDDVANELADDDNLSAVIVNLISDQEWGYLKEYDSFYGTYNSTFPEFESRLKYEHSCQEDEGGYSEYRIEAPFLNGWAELDENLKKDFERFEKGKHLRHEDWMEDTYTFDADFGGWEVTRAELVPYLKEVINEYKEAIKDYDSEWKRDWADSILIAFQDYQIAREFFLAAYARDVRKTGSGSIDERKFEISIGKIIKREALGTNHYYGFEMLVGFTRFEFQNGSKQTKSSPYDKGIGYERTIIGALKNITDDVSPTTTGADYGADVIFSILKKRFVGQCKALKGPAGIKAVQEAVSAIAHFDCDYAVVFSDNGFTDPAISLAESNKVLLITGTDMTSLIRQLAVYMI